MKLQRNSPFFFRISVTVSLMLLSSALCFGQTQDSIKSSLRLKKLSLEDLMNIEVTSISMRPERLTEVASAIQVITPEAIYRSGVVRLPEALRLSSNLQIAQASSHDFSVTARGFSGLPTAGGFLSNKLLAMIDGRSIYSPLFAGVFWDVQNVMLEDIDVIEVVSGPGGSLWGANAVNGVISIKTKSARATQGLYVSQLAGTSSYIQDNTEMRYGSKIGEDFYFRIYGQHFGIKTKNDSDTINRYRMKQSGFRMDYYPSEASTITLQGDFYAGDEKKRTNRYQTTGQNVLGRFTHLYSDESNLSIQMYFDRTTRKTPDAIIPVDYKVSTLEIDVQYRFPIGNRQSILMGGNYRYLQDMSNIVSLNPQDRVMPVTSGFIQDEIEFIPDLLKVTVGSKFLHNVFTGFEIQPSARVAFTPNTRHTIWTAVSRAVRTPSRFDSDLIGPTAADLTPLGFDSENVNAYELGYRARPVDKLSFSLATFFNQYTDLRSINFYPSATSPDPATPFIFTNDQKAESWGVEFSGNIQLNEWWRFRVGYTYFKKDISTTSDLVIPLFSNFEGVDPKHRAMLQSITDLPKNFQFDVTARYVDQLKSIATEPITPSTPAYFTFDARLAKQFNHLEVSIVGQNLIEKNHVETGVYAVPRSVYAKVACRF
jgi:iron complex outermembrane recepter protein